jgi:hypothetical protein
MRRGKPDEYLEQTENLTTEELLGTISYFSFVGQ